MTTWVMAIVRLDDEHLDGTSYTHALPGDVGVIIDDKAPGVSTVDWGVGTGFGVYDCTLDEVMIVPFDVAQSMIRRIKDDRRVLKFDVTIFSEGNREFVDLLKRAYAEMEIVSSEPTIEMGDRAPSDEVLVVTDTGSEILLREYVDRRYRPASAKAILTDRQSVDHLIAAMNDHRFEWCRLGAAHRPSSPLSETALREFVLSRYTLMRAPDVVRDLNLVGKWPWVVRRHVMIGYLGRALTIGRQDG